VPSDWLVITRIYVDESIQLQFDLHGYTWWNLPQMSLQTGLSHQ